MISTSRLAKERPCLIAFWLSLVIVSPAHSQADQSNENVTPASLGQSEWIKPGNTAPSVGQSEWIKPGQQSTPLAQFGQQTTGLETSLPPGTKQRLLGEVLEQEELRSQGTMPSFQGTMPMAQEMSNQGMMPMGQGMFNQGMVPMGQGMFNQGMMPMGQGMFNQGMMPMGQGMLTQQNPLDTGMKALNLLMNIMPGDNRAGGAIAMPAFGGGFQSHMGGGFRSQMSGGGRIYSRPRGSLLGEIGDLAGYAARHAIRSGVYGGLYRGW